MRRALAFLGLLVLVPCTVAGCVRPAPPSPAVMRENPPPWPAPRDAVSHIDAASLRHVRLDATDHQRIFTLRLSQRGVAVPVVANIGIDRVRAVQAPVHTHDDSGQVWLEGEGTEEVTLASFFTVWGVRFSAQGEQGCLGDVCGRLVVTADGAPVADPAGLHLVDVRRELDVAVD